MPTRTPRPTAEPARGARHAERRALAAILGALALLAGALDARADEPAGAETPGVRFVDGFAAGAARAGGPDRLLFVYVGRHRPFCPGCARLERDVFSKPDSRVLSDRWVAVRVLGGEDETPAAKSFLDRYDVEGFPALLVLTADGQVVVRDLLADGFPDTAALVRDLERAEVENRAFREREASLRHEDSAESLQRLALLYLERSDPRSAAETMLRVAERSPSPGLWEQVVALAAKARDPALERRALDLLLQRWPDHPDRVAWLVRRATMDLEGASDGETLYRGRLERLEALRKAEADAGRREGEAQVRLVVADLLRDHHDEAGADEELRWVVAHLAEGGSAARAHLLLARAAVRANDLAAARTEAEAAVRLAPKTAPAIDARALLAELAYGRDDAAEAIRQYEKIVEEAPDSEAAERARAALPDLRREAAGTGR